jgi:amidase
MESNASAAVAQPVLAPAGGAIVEMSATALSRAIQARKLSCVEVLQAYGAQIDRFNPVVNALVAPMDRDWLRGRARELDNLLARGQSLGPLHGFPQAPKDIMPAAFKQSSMGSTIVAGQVSQ